MNELFRNEINVIRDSILLEGVPTEVDDYSLTLEVKFLNQVQLTTIPVTFISENNSYKSTINPNLFEGASEVVAHIAYEYQGMNIAYDKVYEVNNRLVEFDDYIVFSGLDAVGDEYISVDEYQKYEKLESVARKIVEMYCYQKFNYWHGERKIITNPYSIALPQRIEKIESITTDDIFDEYLIDEYSLSNELWYDKYNLTDDGCFLNYKFTVDNSDIFNKRKNYSQNTTILGWWGFKTPPADVVTAAKYIMKLYGGPRINDRNNYIYNSSSNGDSFSFNFSAFRDSTGSIIADDLLSSFRIINGFVV